MVAGVPWDDADSNTNRGREGGMHVVIRPLPFTLSELTRPRGEVHLWVADSNGGRSCDTQLLGRLTATEVARAAQYKHTRPREQFIRSRGLLRGLLAGYLGHEPQQVEIETGPDGKPIHVAFDQESLQFNVSHTDGLAVFAVADRPVGVDVEAVRPVPTADDLVKRFFTPGEAEQYGALPTELRQAAFFRGWTCKEAVLKGIGCGARQLDRCAVDLDPARPARVVGPSATRATWSVATWRPAVGYVGAIAVETLGPLWLDGA